MGTVEGKGHHECDIRWNSVEVLFEATLIIKWPSREFRKHMQSFLSIIKYLIVCLTRLDGLGMA